MPDKNGNLYLYEAIELRSEYDRHVELLGGLLGEPSRNRAASSLKHIRSIKTVYGSSGVW